MYVADDKRTGATAPAAAAAAASLRFAPFPSTMCVLRKFRSALWTTIISSSLLFFFIFIFISSEVILQSFAKYDNYRCALLLSPTVVNSTR